MSGQDEPDEALMARIQAGDRKAFEQIVRRHLTAIHAYAFRLSRSRADADDIAQEAFLRVWQKSSTFRFHSVRVATWIHRITHNVFIDMWRRREPAEPLDDETVESLLSPPQADDDADLLQESIGRLPLNQRTAVSLSLLSGFSTEEAAHIMGMSAHAVESLIARARRTLRAVFRQQANGSSA